MSTQALRLLRCFDFKFSIAFKAIILRPVFLSKLQRLFGFQIKFKKIQLERKVSELIAHTHSLLFKKF